MDLYLDNPAFCGLAVFFTLLFLLNIRSFLKISPSLADCIVRWKGNVDLEDSIQLSRSRNWIAAILFIPLCLVAFSNRLYEPDIISGFTPVIKLLLVIGAFFVYLLLRTFLNWQLEMHNYGSATFTAANRSFYNYCIILFFLLLFTGAIVRAVSSDDSLVKSVLLWETALSYVVYIFRRGQIFASACSPFATILYLCSLELLPTAALVLSARLL